MALCKRRGFIYQASEIYGGINGFWDYGPLGAQLKQNLRDAWWDDNVMRSGAMVGPNGKPVSIVPVDTCIIQHPRVWEASGHVAGFSTRWSTAARRSCATGTTTSACTCRPRSPPPLRPRRGRARATRASRSSRSSPTPRARASRGRRPRRPWRRRRRPLQRRAQGQVGPRARARRREGRFADRASRLQPDVQDVRGRDGDGGQHCLSPARDRAGHIRPVQERRRYARGSASRSVLPR